MEVFTEFKAHKTTRNRHSMTLAVNYRFRTLWPWRLWCEALST